MSAGRWLPPTSATASSAGRPSRSRCCTRRSAVVDHEGLLAVHSLSKRSNLAGYRAGFVAGDDQVSGRAAGGPQACRHDRSAPVQEAMIDLLGDQDHVEEQRARYLAAGPCCGRRWRRRASGSITPKGPCTCGRPVTRIAMRRSDFLARKGILVAPGEFYGAAAGRHIRFALTATDERVAAAATRLNADLSESR